MAWQFCGVPVRLSFTVWDRTDEYRRRVQRVGYSPKWALKRKQSLLIRLFQDWPAGGTRTLRKNQDGLHCNARLRKSASELTAPETILISDKQSLTQL